MFGCHWATIPRTSLVHSSFPVHMNKKSMELTKSLTTSFPTKQWTQHNPTTPKLLLYNPSQLPTLTHSITRAQLSSSVSFPTMSDIIDASRAQNLDIELQTIGPFYRITAKNMETRKELGRAEGVIRVWFGGKILHLDSMKMERETVRMEKSIFGIGLFLGAVAIRHGFESGCVKAELLAINDTDLYHSKLVKFYTRIGFKQVYEVTGSSLGDLSHQLMWGGVGTRMDANIEDLMRKWCSRFKSKEPRR